VTTFPSRRSLRRVPLELVAVVLVALGVRIVFMLFTGRVWEDALITLAHAQNAVAGLGLTHHVGEGPTHGFTSALSVTIPLAGEVVSRGSGFVTLQLASLVATIVTLVYARAIAVDIELSGPARFLVLIFLAVEQNHVFYGATGMETQIAVAALVASMYYGQRGAWLGGGTTAAVACLARPDFILVVPIVLGAIWLKSGARRAVRATAVAAVLVAPWLAFTTLYYGSPVPHTIAAKSVSYSTAPDGPVAPWIVDTLASHVEPMLRTFMPFLADTMVDSAPVPAVLPAIVSGIMYVLLLRGLVAAIRDRRLWPFAAFVIIYGAYRVVLLPTSYYDWYVPPFTAAAIFLIAVAVDRVSRGTWRVVLVSALAIAFLVPLPWLGAMERAVQEGPEDSVRREVALYLAGAVEFEESVTSESAGYIGYYSRVLLWDFPGLTSPTALGFLRDMPRTDRNTAGLVAAARPAWAVLRASEWDVLSTRWPGVAREYELCATFGPGGESLEVLSMVKRSYDLRFDIYRRGTCPAMHADP